MGTNHTFLRFYITNVFLSLRNTLYSSGPVFVMCTASQNLRQHCFGIRPCPPSCPAHGKQFPGPGDEIKIARIIRCHCHVGWIQHTMACALVQETDIGKFFTGRPTFLRHHAVFKISEELAPISILLHARKSRLDP